MQSVPAIPSFLLDPSKVRSRKPRASQIPIDELDRQQGE